jgi:hypothetical protein
MKVVKVTSSHALVEMDMGELLVINNALNEVCNGIDIPEFDTRIGASIADTRLLLGRIGQIIDDMSQAGR